MPERKNKIMALDVGDARIGVAFSDELGMLAHPAGIIERAAGEPVARIVQLAAENGATEVVLGLPRNMDGTEGRQARNVRRFGERLKQAAPGLTLLFQDERLTTVEARAIRRESGSSRSKRAKPVDDVSAALILQSYLDTLQARGGGQ
jgi:putative holliday junction resolvase